MDFIAIDVETANADMSSICQVGIAGFEGGRLAFEWSSYVDPQDWFDPVNVSIHGITPEHVQGQPTLPDIAEELRAHLEGRVAVCHTHFDRVAVSRAYAKHRLAAPACTWLDSARVARRTWEKCAYSGYGLASVCNIIRYDFCPHDALEDAKAAGHVLLAAIKKTGLSVEDWLRRVEQPIDLERARARARKTYTQEPVRRDGDPEGPLHGEVMVFTGALKIPRQEAADIAASLGCDVHDNVTKRTTLLVIGEQDVRKLRGHEKSSKHRRAEELIAKGKPLRILSEADFLELVQLAQEGRRQG